MNRVEVCPDKRQCCAWTRYTGRVKEGPYIAVYDCLGWGNLTRIFDLGDDLGGSVIDWILVEANCS